MSGSSSEPRFKDSSPLLDLSATSAIPSNDQFARAGLGQRMVTMDLRDRMAAVARKRR